MSHVWQLSPVQIPGAVRRVCAACEATAETKVFRFRPETLFRAPFGTPLRMASISAAPPCTGRVADGSTPPVEHEAE